MKKIIRLTESDLHRIIKESVKRILREEDFGSMDGGDIGGGDSVGDMGGGDIGPIEDSVDAESVGNFAYDAPAFIDKKTARRNNLCNFGELGKGAV